MDRLGTVYGKPLIEGLASSPERALKMLKMDVLRRIRLKLLQSTFSDRAKKAFSRALAVNIGPSSLTIVAKHPAFAMMLKGRDKKQMRWLVKAKAPIPIITEEGELIFRSATPRSMANGKWVHPGRKGADFLEQAKKEAKEAIKKRLIAEVRKTVLDAFRGKIR